MKITARVALEVAHHEGLVTQAYKDSVGVWTWSVGITGASGHNVTRYINKPQTIQKCLEVYVWLLDKKYAKTVREVFKGYDLTEAQFAAALSFHWNTGGLKRALWVRHYKHGNIKAARKAILSWSKAGGRHSKALYARREDERDLFFDGKWSNKGYMVVYPTNSRHKPVFRLGKRTHVKSILLGITGETDLARTVITKPKPALPPKVEPVVQPSTSGGLWSWLFG